jgi:hypothetical protein
MLKHYDTFRLDKNNIGLARNLKHRIDLKNIEPNYSKLFPNPNAHRGELKKQFNEWLKMGLVQSIRSRYNSPFIVCFF